MTVEHTDAVPEAGDGHPIGRGIRKVLRGLELAEATIGVLVLLGIVLLVMIQVLVRFTSFAGWTWTGELARFGLVWLTFVMMGYLQGRDEHITLDAIDHLLSERGRQIAFTVAYLIVGVISVAFVYEGLGLMDKQARIRSSAARLPMSWVYAVPTLGFALTAVRAFTVPFVRRTR